MDTYWTHIYVYIIPLKRESTIQISFGKLFIDIQN